MPDEKGPSQEEIDRILMREFLLHEIAARKGGVTPASLDAKLDRIELGLSGMGNSHMELRGDVKALREELKGDIKVFSGDLKGFEARLTILEERISKLETTADDSGIHKMTALDAQLEKITAEKSALEAKLAAKAEAEAETKARAALAETNRAVASLQSSHDLAAAAAEAALIAKRERATWWKRNSLKVLFAGLGAIAMGLGTLLLDRLTGLFGHHK